MEPLGVVAIVGAVLSMLAYSRRPARPLRVTLQFVLALGSFGLLWFATSSSFAHEGMVSLVDHMIGHILTMFIIPMGIVGSGFARSLWWVLSPDSRRRLLRWWYLKRRWHAPKWLFNPIVAALVLNVVMVSFHLPSVFDYVMVANWRMDWVVEPLFVLSGIFFFHFIIVARPRKSRWPLKQQLVALLVTLAEMWFLAMSMSIFSSSSWYSVMLAGHGMAVMAGMATTPAQAFSQQRLAAGWLWICGDAWAIPCTIFVLGRMVKREGSMMNLLERQASRLSGAGGASL